MMDVPNLLALSNVGIVDVFLDKSRGSSRKRGTWFSSHAHKVVDWLRAPYIQEWKQRQTTVLDATELKESRGVLLHLETHDVMAGEVDEGAVTLAVAVALGCSVDFASEVVPCRL